MIKCGRCFRGLLGSDLFYIPNEEYRFTVEGTPGFLLRFLTDGCAPSKLISNASSWFVDLLLMST